MGLAFDLAEAINVGIGLAGGSSVKPLEARAKDWAFRQRLIREALNEIDLLAGAKKTRLKHLLKQQTFWTAVLQGSTADLVDGRDLVETSVTAVAETISADEIEHIGRSLGALYVRLALDGASPSERVLHGLISSVGAQQRTGFQEIGASIEALRSTDSTFSSPSDEKIFHHAVPEVTPWFVGREPQLASLKQAQRSGFSRYAIVATGGMGKSMLAAKHAERMAHTVDVIWWIQADSLPSVIEAICELGRAIHVDWPPDRSPQAQAQAVLTALGSIDRSWLIVYDNVAHREDIDGWLPSRGRGQVLITGRPRDLSAMAPTVDLHELHPSEAATFLTSRVALDNDSAARVDGGAETIAAQLGFLPLALEQAGAYVARNPSRTWLEYQELLERVDLEAAFPKQTRPVGYPDTVLTTWSVSIEAAARENDLAELVLQVLSHLAPRPIPTSIPLAMNASKPSDVSDALTALHAYSLIAMSVDSLSIHRLIQTVTKATAPAVCLDAAAIAVLLAIPKDVPDIDTWRIVEGLAPHLIHILESKWESPNDPLDLSPALLRSVGELIRDQALWGSVNQALPLAKRLDDIMASRYGPNHREAIAARRNWGVLLSAAGHPSEAVDILEDLLKFQDSAANTERKDIAATVDALALAYSRTGDLVTADALRSSRLEASEPSELDEVASLMSQSDVAYELDRRSQYVEAQSIFSTIVPALEGRLGRRHPKTMKARQGLAITTGHLGYVPESVAMLRELLADKKELFGDHHISTLKTWTSLASTLSLIDAQEALKLAKDVRSAAREGLGMEHPLTLDAEAGVGVALGAVGRHDDAAQVLRFTYDRMLKLLGQDSLITLNTGANLAAALVKTGRRIDGIRLMEKIISVERFVRGKDHLNVKVNRAVLAEFREPPARTRPRVAGMRPNDPCPCGSGSKYKRCHGSER